MGNNIIEFIFSNRLLIIFTAASKQPVPIEL